jgi:hypothetical protein
MLHNIRRSVLIAAAVVTVLFIAVAFVGVGRGSAAQGPRRESPDSVAYSVRLISPAPGDVLVAGQRTTITWDALLPKIDLTWCEQEITLSLDGGKTATMRLTPQLDPRAKSFDWLVPDAPTEKAVLILRFGCEGTFQETAYPQTQSVFTIASSSSPTPKVSLRSLASSEVAPGESVTIGWDSNVADVSFYEVKVSYDQGAHFHRLAKTDKTEYSWKVPSDMSGHATFKVVAHTKSGELVESSTSAKPDLMLRRAIE